MTTSIPGNVIIFVATIFGFIKLTLAGFRIATAIPSSYPKIHHLVSIGCDVESVVGAFFTENLAGTVILFIIEGQMVSS